LKGLKQHLQRPPLEPVKAIQLEKKGIVIKVAEDEGLVPSMSWRQKAEEIRRQLRQ
jgi:hypothetical protein